MSLTSTTNRADFGVTSATNFPYNFKVFDAADLEVYRTDSTGVQTLVSPALYTVNGVGSKTGSIDYATHNSSDLGLVILRVVDETQPTVLRGQSTFYADVVEKALDRLVMISQQIRETFNRTLKMPVGFTGSTTLPTPVEGTVLGWVGGQLRNLSAATAQLAADLLSSAAGKGASLITYLAPYTGAVGRLLLAKLAEDVSVTDFGAVGDGVTDDTLAFQRALNAHRRVKVPPTATSYITKKLVAFFDGQEVLGSGWQSCILFKTGETGETFNTNGKRVLLKDLRFYGGDDSGKSSLVVTEPGTGAPLDRSGIYMDCDLDCIMDRVVVHGYGYRGFHARNASANRQGGTVMSNCHAYNCWSGLDSLNNAEYFRGNGNAFGGCQYGVIVGSGNQTHIGGIVNDNYINVQIYGTGVANNAHGCFSGTLINHATLYAIQTIDVTNGFAFIGCNLFYGSVYLKNSSGIIISNGIFDITNFFFEGGGRNYVRNNFTPNTLANNMNHNYNSSTSDTVATENFVTGGLFSKDSVPVKGRPNFAGGNQVFEQWGEPGALNTDGFLWSTNAGDGKLKLWGLNASAQNANASLEVLRTTGAITAMLLTLPNYANDAAAAAGGIPVGGAYRNGSVLMVRVV